MANSLSGKLKGGKYKQKLQFVPDADNEPKVGHEISEPAIFRFLLNEETHPEKFDEAAEVEIVKMLEILKDIDKQSKITQVEAYQSSMMKATDAVKAYHVFIVFKSTSETADDAGVYWWSLEKNSKYIVLQRSRNKENVKEKFKGEERTRVKLIKEDLKGKGTIKDLFEILWVQQLIAEKYHIKKSNCQSLVIFVGQHITQEAFECKSFFPYSAPRKSGRDKKMLELINVIRGCSDWSPLFHLIQMGSTDLVDKTVASGKYDINALYNGLTPLHLAIRLGKTKMVKHLLQPPMNADPTKRDASGKSALLFVASRFEKMKEEIIYLLLAHDKVNVDDVDEDGRTALHLAAKQSNVKVFQKLLERGANPNIYDNNGMSPLHMAVQPYGNETVTDLLLAHDKVMIDHVNKNGQTALHWAAWASNVVAVKKLIEKGANPNIYDKKGRSPLHFATHEEDYRTTIGRGRQNDKTKDEIIDLLLAHDKVMIDHADENGRTALHWAVGLFNVVAVQKLIENGANPNINDKWGQSPLHVAAKKSDGNKIIDLLLAHSKVKVDDVNANGHTALHIAAYESNDNVVKYLINKGANPNAVDKLGDTPLLVATVMQRFGNRFIIDLLLEAQKVKGIGDVNDRNKEGRTALHYAAAFSNKITAEYLIEKGANVNCRANVDDTPLHYAALGAKDMKIIDLLLQNISEVEQYRNDERLFFFARHNVHGLGNKILDRLVEKGIKPPCTNQPTDDCITAESDDEATGVNTRRFVLDKGADPSIDLTGFDALDFLIARVKISLGIYDNINRRDHDGQTLFLIAIRANDVNWVKLLLEKGTDPTIRDKYGETPFHVAVENYRDFDILNLLLESGKVDINETTPEYGRTALHLAIERSNKVTAEFLLSKGANPNVTNKHGLTPLHYAAAHAKDMDIVELLLNHKDVDVNLIADDGFSALDYATDKMNGLGERIANLLKEKGAVEIEDRLFKRNNESLEKLKDYTSSNAEDEIESVLSDATVPNENKIARIQKEYLISAITDRDVESVRRLLENGADISSARGKLFGENALHVASLSAETTDLIDVILETGKFDINGVDNKYGWTPLHWAIMGTNRESNARHLIQKGADPTIANKEGSTPLHWAAFHAEEIETISLILENEQVDINSRGSNGRTALHHAIEGRNVITVRYLLKKGADPNAADEDGATPLHLAAKYEYDYDTTELINIILKTGKCNINGVDNNGRTPLHYVIGWNYSPATINVRRLIEMGADPGIADKDKVTPLHIAAIQAKSMDLIDELLLKVKTGAVDVNCVDKQGRTPLAYARDNKYGLDEEIIDRLKEYGAKE